MQEIINEDKYLIISNGNDVIHHVHNTIETVTSSGQPFMLIGDTEEYVNDLFYSEWSYNGDGELIGIPYPIDWIIGHDTEEQAMVICDAIMSVSPFVKFGPIKHPDKNEWANPLQYRVIEEIPEGEVKDQLEQILIDNEENKRTNEQMKNEGWF